jgi:CheY-like chemotaxis protein
LPALVAETVALVKPGIAEGIEVELEAPAALKIVGDATQLRQLVMNLILNASDAIAERPGRIRIRVAHADRAATDALAADRELELGPDHGYALLEVTDTGRGMSDQIRARIFEPFYTTKVGGRGLGLAAALGTVRGHHGALTVESREGLGSTFRVFLPCAPRELAASAPSSATDDWRGAGLVLIVDDDRGVATAAARMVTEMGFEVVVATSGHEAVACVTEHPAIALALVDLRMPGLGGAATYAGLQRHQPDLPVILMSGFHDRAERPDGTLFLAKPFSLDELTHAIRGAMQSKADL